MAENRFRLELTPIGRELQTPTPPGGLLTTLAGNYQALFKGSGLDFSNFKEYSVGEDAGRIDWKASLKSDSLLIKEFIEERNSEVLFCYDVSSGMIFGSKKLKAHYGAEFIASLGKHIIEGNDAIGLLTFTDKVNEFFYPGIGVRQLDLVMDIVSLFSTYGGRSDFKKVLDFLEHNVLEGTTIILISDFFSFKKYKKYERSLRVIRSKLEVIFVILRDPVEEFLDQKQKEVLLRDPGRGSNILINPSKVRKRYVEETLKEKQRLKEFLKSVNIPVLELYTDKSFIEPLVEFFARLDYNR